MKEPKNRKADIFMESSDDIFFRESDIFDGTCYDLDDWKRSSVQKFRCLYAIHPHNSSPQWVGFMPSVDGTCVRILTFQTRADRENFKISIHFPEVANKCWRYLKGERAFEEMPLDEVFDKINEILSVVGISEFDAQEKPGLGWIGDPMAANSYNITESPDTSAWLSEFTGTPVSTQPGIGLPDKKKDGLELEFVLDDLIFPEDKKKGELELGFTLDDDLAPASPGQVLGRLKDFLSQSPFGRMVLDSELEGDK